MAINRPLGDQSYTINSVYKITWDVSGWDKVAIHVVAPMSGSLFVYGSNDGGALIGVRDGMPQNATNFQPILATNLATGSTTAVISAAGTYSVPVNDQYMRLQGSPAGAGMSVYRIYPDFTKVQ